MLRRVPSSDHVAASIRTPPSTRPATVKMATCNSHDLMVLSNDQEAWLESVPNFRDLASVDPRIQPGDSGFMEQVHMQHVVHGYSTSTSNSLREGDAVCLSRQCNGARHRYPPHKAEHQGNGECHLHRRNSVRDSDTIYNPAVYL